MENVTIAICRDIKLFLDDDVCVGAVREYRVSYLYTSNRYVHRIYIGCSHRNINNIALYGQGIMCTCF